MQLDVGSEFAGYRIEDVAGQGGMGIVYRCTDLALGRPVALKVISADLAGDELFRARFEREAQLAASIDHPNVIPVYATGEADGRLFLAMRFVAGPNLGRILDTDGPLDPVRALPILEQVAGALDAAHSHGLVHRDVKPSNVLLDRVDSREYAYLTDFGLTKEAASGTQLTATGAFVGTLDFIAPEQIKGDPVDARADVYALGCVLFLAVTGQLPFPRDSHVATLYAHLGEAPPMPSAIRPGLHPAFDGVIERALAKEPDARFASAGDLTRAAQAAAKGESVPGAPVSPVVAGAQAPATMVVPSTLRHERGRQAVPSGSRVRSRRKRPSFDAPSVVGARVPTAGPAPRIPLDPAFVYLDEPLLEDGPIPLLGNDEIIDALAMRMAHSSGGSFLVTGFQGVGKTTIVERVTAAVSAAAGPTVVLPVKLNVARARTTSELLYEIMRRLYDEIEDRGLTEVLHPRLMERLSVAYRRTSLSFTETKSLGVERGRGLGIGVPLPGIGGAAPKLDTSRKTSESLATEASYLPYSDAEVEQDFERIVRLFQHEPATTERKRGRLVRLIRPDAELRAPRCQLLVILDELDKLTSHPEGAESVEELLSGLKNLLTIRGAHFVFVAGPDLHERALNERQRGNSVYDAVFGWQVYVPCVWGSEDRLLDALIADKALRPSDATVALRDHLAFWGRGLPRRLIKALQELVRWDEQQPYLQLDGPDLQRIRFCAALERIIRDFVEPRAAGHPGSIELDKWRVGVYYTVEWILRFEVTFTATDVVKLATDASMDRLLALTEGEVEELLEHLEQRGIVRQVTGQLVDHTFYGDEPAAQAAAYEVAEDVEEQLHGQVRFASEARAATEDGARPPSSAFRGAVGSTLADGRYELLEELDRSGSGRVYRARDAREGREVALKVFDPSSAAGSDAMRARFEREGRLAVGLDHPNIVRTHGTFREDDGRLGIVMELVGGASLARRLDSEGPLAPEEGLVVASGVLRALEYLDGLGIARLDLRPSSVMLPSGLEPKLVNLGLAKPIATEEVEAATQAGAVVGTPAYAAPEQLQGREVDVRADMFALALILYEMICGQPARRGESFSEVMDQALHGSVDVEALPVSPELRRVLARATAREPQERWTTPAEMREALAGTPEGAAAAP